ncbi:MAG: CotH kinase family protein [Cystobacter sp.]
MNTDTEQASSEPAPLAQSAGGVSRAPPTHFTYAPLQTSVEEYALEIDPKLLALFEKDEDTPDQPAVFLTPEGKRQSVRIRLRGNSSRSWPKKSWRIELPEGSKYDGRRKLNLLSEWRDSSLMIEKLGYDMLASMGVPAPRGKYVRLSINGRYQGVYLDLERVDKPFLTNHGFADTDGSIYRCGRKNCEMKTAFDRTYQKDWEKKTNEKQPDDALKAFNDTVNYTPEPSFTQALEGRFELESHLRELAVDALISNGTVEDSRSYMVHDAMTGRFTYVPWDYNNTDALAVPFGNRDNADYKHPIFSFSLFDGWVEEEYQSREEKEPGRFKPIFSNLNTRIVLNPELRARELALVEQARDELLDTERMNARIDALFTLLEPHMRGAPNTDVERFLDGPRYLKKYVQNRRRFLKEQLAAWRKWKPGLVLQTVNPQKGYVELRNLGDKPVNTTGLVLTPVLRDTKTRNVPALTLQPGETLRLTSAQLGFKLEPKGELGLFDGKSVVGVLDALYYGALPAGKEYARDAQEPLRWRVR